MSHKWSFPIFLTINKINTVMSVWFEDIRLGGRTGDMRAHAQGDSWRMTSMSEGKSEVVRLFHSKRYIMLWIFVISCIFLPVFLGFPCGSAGKESTCNAGDLDSIPGLGRSPGEGKGYPLQYSGLEKSVVHV